MTEQFTRITGLQATFADVVFADEEWLRAEFDDIIAAAMARPDNTTTFRKEPLPTQTA